MSVKSIGKGNSPIYNLDGSNWSFSQKKEWSQATRSNSEIPSKVTGNDNSEYVVYPERWWLLTTVVFLNLANYSHWVSFASVSKIAATHYNQSGEMMDLIPTVSYGCGVPFTLIATYVVERYGLKIGLHVGGFLTGIGGLACCLSTFPYLSEYFSSSTKFFMALVGQALTGTACPFISCVPTKISQNWFSSEQRTLATILLGMSNAVGTCMGQMFTPLFVQEPSQVPLMNIVWFIPAALGAFLTFWKVTSDIPPTPPSASADHAKPTSDFSLANYFHSIKLLLTNWSYVILVMFVGGAMGYLNTISTKIEQIFCSKGYSNQLAGITGSFILLIGSLSSFIFGLLAYKTKKPILVSKLSGMISIPSIIMMGYFMRYENQSPAIIASCMLFGMFTIGPYPLILELIVECTYPVDQAIGTALIFLSSALQGVLLMTVENFMVTGVLLDNDSVSNRTCIEIEATNLEPPVTQDYSNYLNFITGYVVALSLLFMIFFKTELKRSKADENSSILQDQTNNQRQLPEKIYYMFDDIDCQCFMSGHFMMGSESGTLLKRK